MHLAHRMKVAIAQVSPAYMDLPGSLERALTVMQEASAQGVELLAFGESWLSGYPAWLDHCPDAALWDHAPTKQVFARMRASSVSVEGREVKALAEAAGDLRIALVIGINERIESGSGAGTLFNSLITLGPDGRLLNHHRKLVPTYTERIVWGQGSSSGLRTAQAGTAAIGGLICWEHWMPLARQAMHAAGEHVHVAVWPSVHEMHQVASRHYAFEGRCFVLAAGLVMRVKDLPVELPPRPELRSDPDYLLLRGGSAVIGPDGSYIVEPVYDEERLIVADIDLGAIDREVMTLDVTGHSSRPDVFRFEVRSSD